ncbi:MAG: hypothetical protein CVU89_09300 [Firmicutes bacterium HGW-Firmicutes-14]|nr:MAG: hypothetical protein CVU89_09300 [Firmicutes bacterium HGW-Firmicutes-14]
MEEAILVYKKKKYIDWFLEKHRLKRSDTAKILEFLIDNEELLIKTHFVEDVRYLPNALLISAVDSSTVSFLCRLNDRYYEDIDEIMNLLDSLPPEDFFVRLSFKSTVISSLQRAVLNNKQDIRRKIFYHQVVKRLEWELTRAIICKERHKTTLLAQIDLALQEGDKEKFFDLTAEFKKIVE